NMKPKTNVAPPRLKSILIKPEHIPLFSSWIDKKDSFHYSINNSPYKFNLLYRASRNGNTAKMFHKKCDNKGATVVVAKVTNSEQIVGGYNPLDWNGNGNLDEFTSDNGILDESTSDNGILDESTS